MMLRRTRYPVHAWFEHSRVHYAHKGRTAILHACELLRLGAGDEILAPSYNCGSEIDPLLHSGSAVVLYNVDRRGRVDVSDLRSRITNRTKAIYVTHYFGFPQALTDVLELCFERRLYLIEDCALGLFSCDGSTRLGTAGDISVFSFPKTLPVPDGGALVVNKPCAESDQWNMKKAPFAAVARNMLPLVKAGLLRWMGRRKASLLLSLLQGSSQALHQCHLSPDFEEWRKMPESYYYSAELTDRAMSDVTKRFLNTFDYRDVIAKRRANFQKLLERFSKHPKITLLLDELPLGVCPLCFPVIVDRRNQVCAELNSKRIDAIPWWAGYHQALSWKGFDDARFLKDNLLALPVHQDLTEIEMTFIADSLLAAA